ncbi:trypsin alpha-3-like [Teleopsis dalmanni]|uniref:trypsin alpha-3-like n=1 Tax=Teleopsis dalmanni TaxID=139649 RepID=UPI0018CED2F3|nr:trypsin alpha-3-like [Teleopsis dalmanni]
MFLKYFTYGLLFILGIFSIPHVKCAVKSPKIIGGTTTTISQAPFVVQIIRFGSTLCGGVLIEPTIVLTATHCVYGSVAAGIQVRGGTTDLNTGGVVRQVARIVISNKYSTKTHHMDIAIVHLTTALTGTNIATIALGTKPLANNVAVKVWGWGYDESGVPSNVLRVVSLKTLARTTCARKYSLSPSKFCAFANGKDFCKGDSGGPLVHNNKLYGLVSLGKGCGINPGVYTSIASAPVKKFIAAGRRRR